VSTAPLLGQHTEAICKDLLHISHETFAELKGAGLFT
jgi:crotonobetainyl-CoA:carnitine CoA-transferase CaiB-like acyl-CoA transferase